MYCNKCGLELGKDAMICEKCGSLVNKDSMEVDKEQVFFNVNINVDEGKQWRERWNKQLDTLVHMAWLKVFFIWIIVTPTLNLILLGVLAEINGGKVDDMVSAFVILFVSVVILVLSAVMISNAKGKIAREKVLLQQAVDIRYLAEYVKVNINIVNKEENRQ